MDSKNSMCDHCPIGPLMPDSTPEEYAMRSREEIEYQLRLALNKLDALLHDGEKFPTITQRGPNGETETLLFVPSPDFGKQTGAQ